MLVGNTEISDKDIIKFIDDYDGLCDFIKSTIPVELQHIDAIYHNTRYFANTLVLSSKLLDIESKKKLSSMLTSNIRVVGYIGTYVSCRNMRKFINKEKLLKYREEDNNEKRYRFSKSDFDRMSRDD